MKAQNKTIVVTGGGNGIGRELVLALLKKEARVVAVDISESALEETARLAGEQKDKFTPWILDITDKNAVEEETKKINDQMGGVDGIINNAGIIQSLEFLY